MRAHPSMVAAWVVVAAAGCAGDEQALEAILREQQEAVADLERRSGMSATLKREVARLQAQLRDAQGMLADPDHKAVARHVREVVTGAEVEVTQLGTSGRRVAFRGVGNAQRGVEALGLVAGRLPALVVRAATVNDTWWSFIGEQPVLVLAPPDPPPVAPPPEPALPAPGTFSGAKSRRLRKEIRAAYAQRVSLLETMAETARLQATADHLAGLVKDVGAGDRVPGVFPLLQALLEGPRAPLATLDLRTDDKKLKGSGKLSGKGTAGAVKQALERHGGSVTVNTRGGEVVFTADLAGGR